MTQWKIKCKKYNPFVEREGNWKLEGLSEYFKITQLVVQ